MSLLTTPLLFIDCQTTATTPSRGQLLQMAWGISSAQTAGEMRIDSQLIALKEGGPLPPKVRKMTGLTESSLVEAAQEGEVWLRFLEAASLAKTAVSMIHYARFELKFFEACQKEYRGGEIFPYPVLCSYEIARRLLPGLPSWGIRAVSGHFGVPLPEAHGAEVHVAATVRIWKQLCEMLMSQHNLLSLEDLHAWLKAPCPKRTSSRTFLVPREFRLGLSTSAGVYRMLGKDGTVLYVGKATSLRDRVNSYFRGKARGRAKMPELMSQVAEIRVTALPSRLDAALVETDEIKQFNPPYNISLREGDRRLAFFSMDLTEVRFAPDETHFCGPFSSMSQFDSFHSVVLAVSGEDCFDERFFDGLDRRTFDGGVRLLLGDIPAASSVADLALRLLKWGKTCREQEPPAPEETDGDDTPVEWTPELVAASIRKTLASAWRARQRARWLGRLCEATLVWEPEQGSQLRKLEVQEGRVSLSVAWEKGRDLPAPNGWKIRAGARRTTFSVASYDRLRTLLTELRGLAQAERPVWLRLNPRVLLDGEALRRYL